jgi:hypothetical protein
MRGRCGSVGAPRRLESFLEADVDQDTAFALLVIGLVTGVLFMVPGFPWIVLACTAGGLIVAVLALVQGRRPRNGRESLVLQLRLAYSGELAAGLAYAGHSRSLRNPEEKERVRTIEAEEWHHRALVLGMLEALGERPSSAREWRGRIVGSSLGALCHVAGWFLPMYGAGRLESRNIVEYQDAARFAREAGRADFIPCLLEMAEVEWEHEAYFRACAARSPWIRVVPLWTQPPSKESLREGYGPS